MEVWKTTLSLLENHPFPLIFSRECYADFQILIGKCSWQVNYSEASKRPQGRGREKENHSSWQSDASFLKKREPRKQKACFLRQNAEHFLLGILVLAQHQKIKSRNFHSVHWKPDKKYSFANVTY